MLDYRDINFDCIFIGLQMILNIQVLLVLILCYSSLSISMFSEHQKVYTNTRQ